jgi:hypothetical protein
MMPIDAQDAVETLNRTPVDYSSPWGTLSSVTPAERDKAFRTLSRLIDVYVRGSEDERRAISAALDEAAKYVMFHYTWAKAIEARRTGSRDALLQGLIPVVMAGGRSTTATGATLLCVLLRSAEATGLGADELFASAADLSTEGQSREQIRQFPSLPVEMRSLSRVGVHEVQTPEGASYLNPTDWKRRPRWWEKLIGRTEHKFPRRRSR